MQRLNQLYILHHGILSLAKYRSVIKVFTFTGIVSSFNMHDEMVEMAQASSQNYGDDNDQRHVYSYIQSGMVMNIN